MEDYWHLHKLPELIRASLKLLSTVARLCLHFSQYHLLKFGQDGGEGGEYIYQQLKKHPFLTHLVQCLYKNMRHMGTIF